MIRTILLALLGMALVLALACLFPLLRLGWYGDLLFQACLFFGGFGLVAGFGCGLLIRQSGQVIVISGPRGKGGRIEPEPLPPSANSAFITSPTDAKSGKWSPPSRRQSERRVN